MTITHSTYIKQQLPASSTLDVGYGPFFSDLHVEFDKKQSRLHTEMGYDNTSLSSGSDYTKANSTVSPSLVTIDQRGNNVADHKTGDIRRQSAYQILEHSSTFLRPKFKSTAAVIHQQQQQQHPQQAQQQQQQQQQQRSVLRFWSFSKQKRRSTQTALRQQQDKDTVLSDPLWCYSSIQPLIITQYPPPPLKYGQIEPASDISFSTIICTTPPTTNMIQMTAIPPSSQQYHYKSLPAKETQDPPPSLSASRSKSKSKSTWTLVAFEFTQCFRDLLKARKHMKT